MGVRVGLVTGQEGGYGCDLADHTKQSVFRLDEPGLKSTLLVIMRLHKTLDFGL